MGDTFIEWEVVPSSESDLPEGYGVQGVLCDAGTFYYWWRRDGDNLRCGPDVKRKREALSGARRDARATSTANIDKDTANG